jgi:hypothetical protein
VARGRRHRRIRVAGDTGPTHADVPPDDHARWSSGPFYEVDDVERFVGQPPQLSWVGESIDVPGGRSASLSDPAGNIIHIFDQTAPHED